MLESCPPLSASAPWSPATTRADAGVMPPLSASALWSPARGHPRSLAAEWGAVQERQSANSWGGASSVSRGADASDPASPAPGASPIRVIYPSRVDDLLCLVGSGIACTRAAGASGAAMPTRPSQIPGIFSWPCTRATGASGVELIQAAATHCFKEGAGRPRRERGGGC